jgi:two-component system, chemotaxis family, protein-glutamate methylesterase/glutaminase
VVVQHMPMRFTAMFAERLNEQCVVEVREAKDGDRVLSGQVLIAPGGLQTRVVRSGGTYSVRVAPGDLVNGHAPSVDVMMQSVARHVASNAVGVLLTGMGGDGAEGLLAMRNAGARTIAQDEASCVVFGMPKVALEKGAVERMLPLEEIAGAMLSAAVRGGS